MKKHIFAIFVCVLMAIMLVAFVSCGETSTNTPTDTTAKAEENTDTETGKGTDSKAEHIPSEGLEFVSNGNRTCYISGIGTCPDENVVIPRQSPKGDFVINIGAKAFYNCYGLVSVSFENDSRVANIGSQAFAYCDSLKLIEFPKSLTSIAYDAIANCDNLEIITVESGNTVYSSEGNCIMLNENGKLALGCKNSIIPNHTTQIGDYAFYSCSGLASIEIPASIVSIGHDAFYECKNLKTIIFAENSQLTSIKSGAFRACNSLNTIEIPDTVTIIESDAFSHCGKLASVNLSSGITNISTQTFDYCSSLEHIDIPTGVMSIDYSAFRECRGLKSLKIPKSITNIGNSAFSGCSSLTIINYNGTKEEWISSIGFDWDRDTVDYTINCTNGNIEKPILNFVSNGDGTCYVSGLRYYNSEIVIPEKSPDGDVVIGIGNVWNSDESWSWSSGYKTTVLNIPSTITGIDWRLFFGCYLKTVNYAGTMAQWNAIRKDYDWDRDIGNYTVYCTDGNIAKADS